MEVRAVSYSNPEHRASSGRCCELFRFNRCTNHYCHFCDCDNRFFFCLRGPTTGQDRNTGNCPLGSYSVEGLESDSFTFDTPSLTAGVPNPLLFPGSIWPVSTGQDSAVSIYLQGGWYRSLPVLFCSRNNCRCMLAGTPIGIIIHRVGSNISATCQYFWYRYTIKAIATDPTPLQRIA